MKSGDMLGERYRLDQEIGRGAMGEVWAAFDLTLNRKVAVKAILPQTKERLTNDLRQRLLREARACRKLAHRHIVQIFDVGETPQGEPFIVLELLHGQTLADRLKEHRRIEPAVAARIAGEVASGLAVAHAANVVHRDLKPANIFLHHEEGAATDTFVSKILDFGVCKDLESSASIATQTGMAVGSPAYMSPEQVSLRKDIDGRTDIWSLGIVLFEMLTGGRPFTGAMQDLIRSILLTPVPPPSSKVREVPTELDAIVARCTTKRDARIASAEELSNALLAIAKTTKPMTRKVTFTGVGAPPSAQPLSSQERPSSFAPTSVPTPLPIAPPRVATNPTPPADDDDDGLATVPLGGHLLKDLRRGMPSVERREVAPTGTQILQQGEPLASPAPTWNKNEMKEVLAAHRQSSAVAEAGTPESVGGGHTQMLTDSHVDTFLALDPAGTTSGAGALSQRTSGYPAPPPPLMPMALPPQQTMTDPAISTGRHKKNKKVLLGLMTAGVVVAVATVVVLVLSMKDFAADAQSSAKTEAKPVGSSVMAPPTVPEPSTPPVASPPSTMAGPTESAAPGVTAAPTVAGTSTVTAPQVASSQPTSTFPVPPPKPPPQGGPQNTSSQSRPLPPFSMPSSKPVGQAGAAPTKGGKPPCKPGVLYKCPKG